MLSYCSYMIFIQINEKMIKFPIEKEDRIRNSQKKNTSGLTWKDAVTITKKLKSK